MKEQDSRKRILMRLSEQSVKLVSVSVSVGDPDPDPFVFGPPRSGSGHVSQRYGSRSLNHQAKIVRKTLIPTIL
jgi:hypothetical protein